MNSAEIKVSKPIIGLY